MGVQQRFRFDYNILRIILHSTYLPSTAFAPFLLGQSARGMTTGVRYRVELSQAERGEFTAMLSKDNCARGVGGRFHRVTGPSDASWKAIWNGR